jgi:hypothetical protein
MRPGIITALDHFTEAYMIIVDIPHGTAILDRRGCRRTDKEKLHRRLYGSFAEGFEKTEPNEEPRSKLEASLLAGIFVGEEIYYTLPREPVSGFLGIKPCWRE